MKSGLKSTDSESNAFRNSRIGHIPLVTTLAHLQGGHLLENLLYMYFSVLGRNPRVQ